MKKGLNYIWFAVSVILFIVLIIDCFFVKKMSLGTAISEMWEAFTLTILLLFVTYYLLKKK